MKLNDQINSHYGLFLNHLVQVSDQELVLFLSEARINDTVTKEVKFNEDTEHFVSLDVNPIETDDSCKKYKMTFKRFFAYQVVEESSIQWDDDEVFEGKLYRMFSSSRFLNHIKANLNVDWYEKVPEMKYQHFQVCGLDFIVDVAAHEDPTIEEVEQFLVQ